MGWRLGLGRAGVPLLLLLLLLVLLLPAGPGAARKPLRRKCAIRCTCAKDAALCEGAEEIPRELPPKLVSL